MASSAERVLSIVGVAGACVGAGIVEVGVGSGVNVAVGSGVSVGMGVSVGSGVNVGDGVAVGALKPERLQDVRLIVSQIQTKNLTSRSRFDGI
jgi:hypothetical protein